MIIINIFINLIRIYLDIRNILVWVRFNYGFLDTKILNLTNFDSVPYNFSYRFSSVLPIRIFCTSLLETKRYNIYIRAYT